MPQEDRRIFSQIRLKRLCAFIIDICAVALLTWIAYTNFGFPDYFVVGQQMAQANLSTVPSEATALANAALVLFNAAYFQTLLIWLGYEIICQFLFRGATLGKLAMRIRVVPVNPARGRILHYALMTARSVLKVLSAYIFQGIPLLVAALVMFANKDSQSGYDLIVRTKVSGIESRQSLPLHESSPRNGSCQEAENTPE